MLPNCEHMQTDKNVVFFFVVFSVVPVRKVHALNITWSLPPQEKYYRWVTPRRHTWWRAHKCRNRQLITDRAFPFLEWNCIKCVCFFYFHAPVSSLQRGASSHKHRIIPATRHHALSWFVEGLHQRFLFLFFISFPSVFRVKPLHYISWLIGHEGTGSILSVLRKKWVLLPLSVCFSDLRALQNSIKRSSICWVYMRFFKLQVLEANLETIHFASPLDDVIHTVSSLDVAVEEHFSLLLLSGKVIHQTLCSPTIPRAHPIVPLPSAPLRAFDKIFLFTMCAVSQLLINDSCETGVHSVSIPSQTQSGCFCWVQTITTSRAKRLVWNWVTVIPCRETGEWPVYLCVLHTHFTFEMMIR